MGDVDERFLDAVSRLGVVAPETLDAVRAQMRERGQGRSWAEQQLLKRSPELTPKQVAQVHRALDETREISQRDLTERPRMESAETRVLPARRRVDPALGDVLSRRFRLDQEIGRGAQGLVYRARDMSLARDVAVKILRTDAPGAAQERFLREAKLVAQLEHPGIVTIFEAGTTPQGDLYYAMELVRGPSLDAVLDAQGPLPTERIVQIVEAVGYAIHHAHDAGLVHRDLKPGNLLIDDDDGTIRVADFGLVSLAEGTRLTLTRGVVGTPVYMAPEQAEGRRVDRRADVYSLGAILYEGLVGRPPFGGATPLEIFRRIVSEDPPPPRSLVPEVPALVEQVCLRALEKDPRARYPTAAAFARDLRRALGGLRLAPEQPAPRLRRKVERVVRGHPLLASFAAGLGLGALAAMGLRPPAASHPQKPTQRALLRYPPEILAARAAARRALLDQAKRERRLGLERAAIGWLRAVEIDQVRWDPGAARDVARARALEVLARLELGELGEAQAALGQAVLFDADDPVVWLARSAFWARRGELERAASLLPRAFAGRGNVVEALLEEAWQANARGAIQSCLASLDRAVDLTRQDPWPVVVRARVQARLRAGNLEAAIWDAQLLIKGLGPGPKRGFEVEQVLARWESEPEPSRRRMEELVASVDTQVRVKARETLRRIDHGGDPEEEQPEQGPEELPPPPSAPPDDPPGAEPF